LITDWAQVSSRVISLLNATGDGDLVWWTTAEIYGFLDEASRKFGQTGAVTQIDPIPASAQENSYLLPAKTLSVVSVFSDAKALRATAVRFLEAMSISWRDEPGPPQRFALDSGGTRSFVLHPKPMQAGTLEVIYHTWPDVYAGPYRAPSVFGLYLQYSALAQARGKEGEAQSLDIADAARARADVLEQFCRKLWGGAQ
jgi:hypothetical protein